MGTNYYLYPTPKCECCGRECEPVHIGKASAGWYFALHVIPEEGINTLEDWKELWSFPGTYIKDEYGNVVPAYMLEKYITQRVGDTDWVKLGWYSQSRYGNKEHFHALNSSERGLNNLIRSKVDGERCVGHGDGTWDYIAGEFS